MIEGIDISRWQASTPSLTGRAFVIARATYGIARDARYAMHAQNVRAAGKVLGAYAFGRNMAVDEQVAAFLANAPDADLYALDLEKDGDDPRMTSAQARAFLAAVQATGRRIGLYMSEAAFVDLGQDWDWVANWSREPHRHWDVWQYRGSPLDLDRFDGTAADLLALGSQETTMTYPVPKVPSIGDVAKGAVLYSTDALVSTDPDRIIVDPGRSLPYFGAPSATVRIVEYVNEAGVHSGKAYFMRSSQLTSIRAIPVPVAPPDTTPFTQADIDAAVAAASVTLKEDLADALAERDNVQADLVEAEDEIDFVADALIALDSFRARHL
jgi:hypothetical protein